MPERTLYFGAVRGVPLRPRGADVALDPGRRDRQHAGGGARGAGCPGRARRGRQPDPAAPVHRVPDRGPAPARRARGRRGAGPRGRASPRWTPGSTWELHATEGDPLGAVTEDLARDLSELNLSQRAFDLLRAEQTTLRRRIFADWYRRTELRAARWRSDLDLDLDGLDDLIERQIVVLDEQQTRLVQQVREIGARRHRVRRALPAGVRLVRSAAPRFHRPNDPSWCSPGRASRRRRRTSRTRSAARAASRGEPPAVLGFDGAERVPHAEAAHARLARRARRRGGRGPAGRRDRAARVGVAVASGRAGVARRAAAPERARRPRAARTGRRARQLRRSTRKRWTSTRCRDDFDALPDEYEGRAPLAANATAALETQLRASSSEDLLRAAAREAARGAVARRLHAGARDARPDACNSRSPSPYGSPLDAAVRAARRRSRRRPGALRPAPGQPVRAAAQRPLHAQRAAPRRRVRPLARRRHVRADRVRDDPAARRRAGCRRCA